MDHIYTNTTHDTLINCELTYKLCPKEIEDLVKLRVSNKALFSGKRNSSMWAWRAILKHMDLHYKMTYSQAAKKWENMKKKYKELKHPPDGVKVFPEAWEHFKLLDDAMQGRLDGSAPVLQLLTNSNDDDFLTVPKDKKRRLCSFRLPASAVLKETGCRSEIEVSIDDEEAQDDEDKAQGGSAEMEFGDGERAWMEGERATMEREGQLLAKERLVLQQEVASLERDRASLERDRASLERERTAIEREKVLMEREKAVLERDRLATSRERLALERERARQARRAGDTATTEDVAAGGDNGAPRDPEALQRRDRFLAMFEKLVENL